MAGTTLLLAFKKYEHIMVALPIIHPVVQCIYLFACYAATIPMAVILLWPMGFCYLPLFVVLSVFIY
jgi:hypothetical protein